MYKAIISFCESNFKFAIMLKKKKGMLSLMKIIWIFKECVKFLISGGEGGGLHLYLPNLENHC